MEKDSRLAELIGIVEAAKILNLCTASLVKLVADGKLKGIKYGGLWKFKRADVDSFIDEMLS